MRFTARSNIARAGQRADFYASRPRRGPGRRRGPWRPVFSAETQATTLLVGGADTRVWLGGSGDDVLSLTRP